MAEIHLSMMGKGGVGKTTQIAFFAQYLTDFKGVDPKNIICIDTDQENASFASFKGLGASKMNIRKGLTFDPRGWDALHEQCLMAKPEQIYIIDNGASTFSSLRGYLVQNKSLNMWIRRKHKVFVHVPFTGGEGLDHAISGWRQMIESFPPETLYVCWLHKFLGPLELLGNDFFHIPEIVELAERLGDNMTVIDMQEYEPALFGPDISYLLSHNLTFKDLGLHDYNLDSGDDFPKNKHGLMSASLMRLCIFRDDLYTELQERGL